MPKIPTQLIDFSLYNKNNRLVGHGDEITMPSIVFKAATIALAGGDIDMPGFSTENMEMDIPFNVFDEEAADLITLGKVATVIIRGALQKADTSSHDLTYKGLKVTTKGYTKEIEIGKAKRVDKMDSNIKQTITYIKIENGDGYVFLEIDKLNGTLIVNGKDLRADMQKYL